MAVQDIDSGDPDTHTEMENIDRTQTEIDVVESTFETPYREPKFIGSYIAALLGACASFTGFLMPVTSLALIEAVLPPSPNGIWIPLAWILSSAISFLLLGRLSDIFGRRWFFTACSMFGLIGSIIGSTVNNINPLIAASVFLGLGASGQLSFIISIGELVPIKQRFVVNGIIFFSLIPFSGLGPYIARLFIVNTSAGYKAIYYLAAGLNGASTILWILFYFPPDFAHLHRNRTITQELKEMDFGGIFLYGAGFFMFLLGLGWGGTVHPWSSGTVLGPLIAGIVVLIVFAVYERFMPLHRRLVPLDLFRNKDFVILNILNAVIGVVYYSANTLFPYMVSVLYTTDVVRGGLLSSCIGCGVAAGQFTGSLIAVPGGMLRLKIIFFSCGITAFTAGLAGATGSENVGIAMAVCTGFCVGVLEVIISTAITIVIEDQSEIGAAGGVFGSIRSAAGVLATAIYTPVFLNKSSDYIEADAVPAIVRAGLPVASVEPLLRALGASNLAAAEKVPGVTPEILQAAVVQLTDAYSRTFKIVWLATLAFGGILVIASVFSSDIDDKLSRRVVRRLDQNKKAPNTDQTEMKHIEEAQDAHSSCMRATFTVRSVHTPRLSYGTHMATFRRNKSLCLERCGESQDLQIVPS